MTARRTRPRHILVDASDPGGRLTVRLIATGVLAPVAPRRRLRILKTLLNTLWRVFR